MPKTETYTSIDIGARYIKGLVVRKRESEWEILAHASVKSRGIDEGEIKDAVAFKESVNLLIEELNEQLQKAVRSEFVISLTSVACEKRDVVREITFGGEKRVITAEVLDELKREAYENLEGEGKKVLHLYPKRYVLDGERVVFNPVDMRASKLSIEYTSVVLPVKVYDMFYNFLQDIVFGGLQLRSSLVSAAEGVLTSSEKDRGVVVLDMGYNFTGVIAYKNGVPIRVAHVPIGMRHVIRDVASVFDTTFDEAERLVVTHGNAVYADLKESEEVQYKGLDGKSVRKTSIRKLAVVIHARLREIMNKSKKIFREIEVVVAEEGETSVPGGVVITGGGAKIPRITDLTTEIFKTPVRIGDYAGSDKPTMKNADEVAQDPSFAAVFGNIFSLVENPYEELPVKREGLLWRIFKLFKELIE